jgi:heme/copper-type cytochrome/quinol oxidase subunit 3
MGYAGFLSFVISETFMFAGAVSALVCASVLKNYCAFNMTPDLFTESKYFLIINF